MIITLNKKKREKIKKNDQQIFLTYKIFINIYMDSSYSILYKVPHFLSYSIMVKTTN
jgi:hypothetical protein